MRNQKYRISYGNWASVIIEKINEKKITFTNENVLRLWMNRPFRNSEEKPVDLIATPGGVDLVHEEIEKLAQG